MDRKQRLLKTHRRNKRLFIVLALITLILIDQFLPWWFVPLLVLLSWVAHEAWFSDHLFYSPREDYNYSFPAQTQVHDVCLEKGKVQLPTGLQAEQTLILELEVKSTWLGSWLDPFVRINDDRQDFERGVCGRRYLNLSGLACVEGVLNLRGHFCRMSSKAKLYAFENPDYSQKRVMILAPHADDAELAAFGLYSRCEDVSIVTLTQGEIEAKPLQKLGLVPQEAAQLKGRLRSWNSLAVPLWGGVPQERCVQLGYYCLRLTEMAASPAQSFGSLESGEADIRNVRAHNPIRLPGDGDGCPSWNNMVADLVALLEHFEPEMIVRPHPQLDPHPDHVAVSQALREALLQSRWQPEGSLLYANHLHDNDRWPMGPAGSGVALPPVVEALPADGLWVMSLDAQMQLNKAMALTMQHDLQTEPSLKKRVRRWIQQCLAGRSWPSTGADEFFRKSVRRHELFWVRGVKNNE